MILAGASRASPWRIGWLPASRSRNSEGCHGAERGFLHGRIVATHNANLTGDARYIYIIYIYNIYIILYIIYIYTQLYMLELSTINLGYFGMMILDDQKKNGSLIHADATETVTGVQPQEAVSSGSVEYFLMFFESASVNNVTDVTC